MNQTPGYEFIFRAGAHPVVIYDRAAVICEINETGARNLGLPRAKCIGRALRDFIPESQEMTVARIAEVLGSQEPALFEDRILLGGEPRWFLSSMEPLADEGGGPPELVLCTSYEITDRKRAEALLEARSQQLHLAAETARLGIWHMNMETGILDWNDRMFELYGVSRDEFAANQLIGMERLHPEDREASDRAFAELNAGSPVSLESRIVRPDGSIVHLYGRGAPVFDSQGKLVQLQGISIDITELKRREKDLAEQEAFLRAVFENSAHGILVADDNGNYLSANPAASHILGYSREQLLNLNVRELRVLGDRRAERIMPEFLERGLEEGELEMLRPDGKPVVISYKAVRVRQNFNLTIIEDITQKKRMEKRENVASRLEAVGNLAGGIAHDFNNVLAAILLQAELLSAKGHAESQKPASRIMEAALHARELVRQIMAFSRQETMPRKLHDLRETIDEATRLVEQLLPDNISIRIEKPPVPATSIVSPVQMTQVVVNLIVNAVDAMRKTGGELTVECRIESSHNAAVVVLSVQDNGPGIPPEHLERIFEPFFSTRARAESSGMGLAVVHGIIRAHGGSIDVTSEPGRGALFTVRLEAASGPAQSTSVTYGRPAPGEDQLILLVEDNELVLESTADILRSLGYRVSGHTQPLKALEEFQASPAVYSLLLTDESMPVLRGTELAEKIRAIRPDLPVLICTGYADAPVETSMHKWLQKPVGRDVLGREIAGLLERAR
jgi:PAS domain S-box-containing protein